MIKKLLNLVFVLPIFFLNTLCGQAGDPDKEFQLKAGWGSSAYYSWTELDIYNNNYNYMVDLTEMLPVSDRFTTNPVNIEAIWTVFRRWELGAGMVYNQTWQRFDKGKISTHFSSLEAIVRYNIVKRDFIRFYAGCLAGPAIATQITWGIEKEINVQASFIPAEIFVGASLGKKFFGFCEIGYGAKGAISGGVGYRF